MFENMDDVEFAAYLAGFTDGEGYIGVEPMIRTSFSSVRIVLANTVPEVIFGIQERLGFGSIRSQKQRKNWREKFTWNVANLADVERFLNVVYPYLVIKRESANMAYARIAEAKRNHQARQQRNEAIRQAARNGQMRKDIAAKYGVSAQTVSRLCEGHKWPSEMSRFAKTRKRDARGLFIPIEH